MKKRSIVIALFALDLIALPAMAQIGMTTGINMDATPQKAVSVALPAEPGLSKYVITANAPFTIVAQNAISEYAVSIRKSGEVNGNRFGENAQFPGKIKACASALTHDASAIYRSTRGTVANDGEILTQAVVVEVRYDPHTVPDLKVLTENDSLDVPRAAPCQSDLAYLAGHKQATQQPAQP